MGRSMFDAYGELSKSDVTIIEKAGRYAFQAAAQQRVLGDVLSKLDLGPSCRLLEIGCGPGNLLIPLSFYVKEAVGIDHPDVVAVGRDRFRDPRIQWIGGEFPNVEGLTAFDRILIYSVVQNLKDLHAVIRFMDAVLGVLAPEGRVLIGDIPSRGRKERFQASDAGTRFEKEWRREMSIATQKGGANFANVFEGVEAVGAFGDEDILGLLQRYRSRGFHTYLLPQPPDLPFGRTREDILILRT